MGTQEPGSPTVAWRVGWGRPWPKVGRALASLRVSGSPGPVESRDVGQAGERPWEPRGLAFGGWAPPSPSPAAPLPSTTAGSQEEPGGCQAGH